MPKVDATYVIILKQLSASNWEYERDICSHVLSGLNAQFELLVDDYIVGKNNKNRNSGYTLIAKFDSEPSHDLIREMRWRIHSRHG